MIELSGLSKAYGKKQIVSSATLSVGPGELLCLAGPSGIGKSTLLEMMAGILPADGGSIRRPSEPALMFQDDVLIPWLNAEANIGYILPAKMPQEIKREVAAEWLRRFGLDAGQYPSSMSGGMRRRLSLARAFASGRKLLLLDEPFAFLDEAWQEAVAREIAVAVTDGSGVVLASHSAGFISFSCMADISCRVISLAESPIVIA